MNQELQAFARLALLEVFRCLHEVKIEEAWEWSRRIFRSGGLGSQRGNAMAMMIGIRAHATASQGIQKWAENRSVTTENLKLSLDHVRSDFALYESRSNVLVFEYIMVKNTINERNGIQIMEITIPWLAEASPILTKLVLFVSGEPERSLRCERQVLTNQIRDIDKPLSKRAKCVTSIPASVLLFQHASLEGTSGQEIAPERLWNFIDSTIVCREMISDRTVLDHAYLKLLSRQVTLEILLAAQAFHRDKNEFPNTIEELVPEYFETVPLDPCDPDGGTVHYRRESPHHAVVWSMGINKNDDNGDVESES
ncbi:MAG: hypothetical protein FJ267_13355, partial [Planctomycetes bacterium]|nr:hypothetical protein [Planctomycetota bacterium]